MKSFTLIGVALLVSFVGLVGTTQADLITNGTFDTGTSGWVGNGIYVDATDPTAYIPDPGAIWVSRGKTMTQGTGHTIAANELYTLSFDAANANEDVAVPSAVHAWLYRTDDNTVLADSNTIVIPGSATEVWSNYSVQFTTLAGQGYLGKEIGVAFSGPAVASPDYNGYSGVDNVSLTVTSIPEPGTLMLLGMGLIGLLAYAWRKRK